MTIYQVFTRLFGAGSTACVRGGGRQENGCGTMGDFTARALREIRGLGCTHIWYTGIIEHATQTDYSAYGIRPDNADVVKGRAGSPYAIKDYYDVDPDIAEVVPKRMEEFESLVERTHREGLGVIIDFVPNHVARQYCSDSLPPNERSLGEDDDTTVFFSPGNNFYYIPREPLHLDCVVGHATYTEMPARATGNDVFHAWPGRNDWYETVKLNYGVDFSDGRTCHFSPVPDTWHKMLRILLFWSAKGVDGFRCDMAEMVPVEFWEWAIAQVKAVHPEIVFIAEVYNPAQYRAFIRKGHFDYLYDKVGLYDTLKYVLQGSASAHSITWAWQNVDDIRGHMLYFLENHDEQRIASSFFAGDAAKGKPLLLVSALMYTNPMMVYFGQELGEKGMDEEGFSGKDGRTTIFDYWTVDTVRRWRADGKFDNSQLTEEEKLLRTYYREVLCLKMSEPVFSEGEFFDVMYVNPHLQRQYVFLRHYRGYVALVAANFEGSAQTIDISIPKHLFKIWNLKETDETEAVDLLTNERHTFNFNSNESIRLSLPMWDGAILLFHAGEAETEEETKSNKQ